MHTGCLANIGNTCSINTLLQCIAHCKFFSDFLINSDVEVVNVKNAKYILFNEIKSILVQLIVERKNIIPRRFVHAFREAIGKKYKAGEELDFTEMWMLMLDRIDEESKKKVGVIFNGTQIQQIKCIHCNELYHNKEEISLHYIHISEHTNTDIINCMREMLSDESIPEWKCDKCTKHSGIKSIHLSVLPKVLVIVIQRCSADEKIKIPVTISDTLIISPPKVTYKLKSFANHYGTQESGHYTATCIDDQGEWYEYNDLHVRKVPSRVFLQNREAYALFYEKLDLN